MTQNTPPYARFAFDLVALTLIEGRLHVALGTRKAVNEMGEKDPFAGALSLPGGYVWDGETAAQTIKRRLAPEIGLTLHPEPVALFDDPKRDPRQRVVSMAYMAFVPEDQASKLTWGKAYASGTWVDVHKLPKENWAFDHDSIVATTLKHISDRAKLGPYGFDLLPEKFWIRSLHALQEELSGEKIDIRNFREQILRSGLITPAGVVKGGPGLPKKLYHLAKKVD